MYTPKTAGNVNLIANIFLFVIKILTGIAFSNLSLVSEALNSLSDIFSAIGIKVSVGINDKEPDKTHPFGHTRAESIASYTVGILMFVLGLEIILSALESFLKGEFTEYSPILFIPIIITLILKTGLYFYIKKILKNKKSPALKANLQDHKNDIFIAVGVLVGLFFVSMEFFWVDTLVSFLIGLYILKTAFEVAVESVDQLIGKAGDPEIIEEVKKAVLDLPEVLDIRLVRSQQLGSKIGLEITCLINPKTTFEQSHNIHHKIEDEVAKFEDVSECAVHLEPLE
jgi:cation diffusion facilitator family transporter